MAAATFIASYGGDVHKIAPGQEFVFGRAAACQVCLDPDDTGISRQSGKIEFDGRAWWLVNASASRPMAFLDDRGIRTEIAPGKRLIADAPGRVIVEGTAKTYEITVAPPRAADTPADWKPPKPAKQEQAGAGSPTINGVGINATDRAALAALFAGYLGQGDEYDPYPASYSEAAKRLGWPRATLVKRITSLTKQLTQAGVRDLDGWNPLLNLADVVVSAGVITPEDLSQLR